MVEDAPNQEGAIDVISLQDVQSRILTIKDASDDLSASGVDAVVCGNGILLVGDAQVSVAHSEARYRHLINQMGAYVVELLPSGDVVYANEAMMELLGVFSGDWHGFDLFRHLLVIQGPPPSGTLKRHFLQADELKDYRTGIFAQDGSSKVLSWNSAHVLDKNKQVVRLIFLGLDVTQQVKAEQEMRIAAIAFESQEGMIVTDANGTILRTNKAFTEITGYHPAEAIGQNPRFLKSGRQDATFYLISKELQPHPESRSASAAYTTRQPPAGGWAEL